MKAAKINPGKTVARGAMAKTILLELRKKGIKIMIINFQEIDLMQFKRFLEEADRLLPW